MTRKYFATICSASGTLAIEKYMWGVLKAEYDKTIIAEDAVEVVLRDLQNTLEEYIKDKGGRLKPVEITRHNVKGIGSYIHVGSVCLHLSEVRREHGITDKSRELLEFVCKRLEAINALQPFGMPKIDVAEMRKDMEGVVNG